MRRRIITPEQAMGYQGGLVKQTPVPFHHSNFGRVTTPLINGIHLPSVLVNGVHRPFFRPQVTGVVLHHRNEIAQVLFTMSPKAKGDGNNWTLPGGGIEEGESLDDAFYRELADEELRVNSDNFEHLHYVGDFKQPGNSKSGFFGKRHLHVQADFVGHPNDLNPDPSEIAEARWVPFDELDDVLQSFRSPERAIFTRKLLQTIL